MPSYTGMTLSDLIAAHHAAHPRPLAVTPYGLALVAANRLARLLADLPYDGRTDILARLTLSVSADPEGETFSLAVSRPPKQDPERPMRGRQL